MAGVQLSSKAPAEYCEALAWSKVPQTLMITTRPKNKLKKDGATVEYGPCKNLNVKCPTWAHMLKPGSPSQFEKVVFEKVLETLEGST